MKRKSLAIVFLALIGAMSTNAGAEFGESSYVVPLDTDVINYDSAKLNDPIARLQKAMREGKVTLQREPRHGYLPALLKELKAPVSSQTLVFSKTSFQLRKIAPVTPRAVYFGDDVYIGHVQGSDLLEASAQDPNLGAIFYVIDQTGDGPPKFIRSGECVQCHASARTAGVPGHIVRSVFADTQGFPLLQAGSSSIDHRSPMKERWGGWYVTGETPRHVHMGNQTYKDDRATERPDLAKGTNVKELSEFFDTSRYLSPHSDIVALMVLEHQSRMHNLITAVNYEAKMALAYEEVMNKALNRNAKEMGETTQRRFKSAADALLKYLLFVEEAELNGPVKGTSTYAQDFQAVGPFDRKGRSLRQLDMNSRMFKYPCSFLIHSEAWDAIPKPMLDYLYQRLFDILTGKDTSETYARLSKQDRQNILEILRETKKGLPAYWGK